ncbi:MAG: class I SAM-dependent methyltransferase [Deltaproteobacteria bacterium]|nr:class I SAM-dependent methyltransferase [Deltaproteobacteria bacterium]
MNAAARSEAHTWDALANRYDVIVRMFDRSYPRVRELLREDLRGCRTALEVSAGTGQFTAVLAEVVEALVASDVSPNMVAQLRTRLHDAGVTNTDVEVMNAYALSADTGVFDAVICANALHVMEQPSQALREFRRVLVPGGNLIVPTFLHGANRSRRVLSRALSMVSPFVAHTRFELATLESLVESEGFIIERAERLPGLFPIGYVKARVGDRA